MKKLFTKAETIEYINQGRTLILAGSYEALSGLPLGNWIAGTSSYFIDVDGGVKSNDKIFAVELPDVFTDFKIVNYCENSISKLGENYYQHGFSYILIPAFSKVHYSYAENCRGYKNIYAQPLMGWIAGFDLDNKTTQTGFVFDGRTGKVYSDKALVMHVELKSNFHAKLDTVNLFEQGNGDVLRFVQNGFTVKDCYIRGELRNFYQYILENECNTELPLVATVNDLQTNISIMSLDEKNQQVHFYAPVFSDVEYQFASPVGFYEDEFEDQLNSKQLHPSISCNCILNYLYAHLEGTKTADVTGPMTFGEISHMLLNQTMVCLTFVKKE